MSSAVEPIKVQRRVGVIGDIHTQVDLLALSLSHLRDQEVELILATGDLVDGPGDGDAVDRACELLERASVRCVSGNHDRWLLEGEMRHLPDATFADDVNPRALEFLRALPQNLELQTPLGFLLLGHGLGADDMATFYPHDHGHEITNNAALQAIVRQKRHALVVFGHTHRRMVRRVDDVVFVNAGSLLRKREPCCLVLDFEAALAVFWDFDEGGHVSAGPTFSLR